MLKRKITSTSNNNKKQKATTLTQSSLSSWVNPQPQTLSTINSETLFNKIGNENKDLLSLEIKTMNSEWLKVLSGEMQKPYFIELKKYLQNEKANNKKIFPPIIIVQEIYSWSRFTPPSSVKVVIIGQDPYHNVGQAHGLCFSVPHGVPPPPSLINIYNSLKKDIPSFQIPKHGNLINWAKAGVLLLNTSLTVRAHEAASHSGKGWEKFTDAVIQYLNEKENGLVFMLWGNHAIKKGKNINENKHLVLQTVHPSPLSAHRGFLVCCHWSKANAYLKSHGKQEIEWNCLSAAD